MDFIPLLQAESGQGGGFMTIVMFALIFVIFYFFIIRPQNKKQKETEKMINAIKKGDKVITIGGMHGEISAVREKTFVLKVEDGSKIEFNRAAISAVVNPNAAAESPAKPEKAKKSIFGKFGAAEEKKEDEAASPVDKGEEDSSDSEKQE